ncbi:helix-turn-helix transcriptional regulator [Actinomadura keratinilytica]|uniref:WYL domain-containing protein n=1 Tax=Actinomadura keratinilytica TaxID=547461 RepID=A0ABP7YZ56_9ACTN
MTDTSARLLRLLSLLQTRREWTGPQLAERLGVTGRTVRRDIERLRALGYPVRATLGPVGGYRLEAGAAMPPLLLDDEEAVAIALGLGAAAGGAVEGIEDAAVRALAKLEQVLPQRLRRRVSALHAATVPIDGPPAGPVVAPETLAVLAAACRDRERLRFAYRAPDSGAEDAADDTAGAAAGGAERHAGAGGPAGAGGGRLVEPHALVSAGRRWYLLAWDVDRADWRTFRVDRMRTPRAVGVRFAPREVPGGDAAQFVRRSLAAARPAVRAVLRVHAPAHVLADRFRVTGQELEPVDERTCLLRTRAESLEWTALRVAFLDLDFEVLEPPELADRLGELGRRLLRAAGRK